jgi:hypothetical protein
MIVIFLLLILFNSIYVSENKYISGVDYYRHYPSSSIVKTSAKDEEEEEEEEEERIRRDKIKKI